VKKWLSGILLCLTLPLAELHCLFSDTIIENWILAVDRPMTRAWNVKYLMTDVNYLVTMIAFMVWYPSKFNRVVRQAFLFLAIFSLIMYIYNFRTFDYYWIYLWALLFGLLAYFWQSNTKPVP